MTIRPADRIALAEPAWFAIQTIPCQEGTAARGLRRAGYWATFPLDRFQTRQRRSLSRPGPIRVRWVDRAHFPGYVFLALRYIGESLAGVSDARGVIDLVRRPISRVPLTIPCSIMDAILDERLLGLDDERGAVVMSETHLHDDRELRVFLSSLGRWRCEPVYEKVA